MPISVSTLSQAASRSTVSKSSDRTITEAKTQGFQTAFLCHSHKDERLVIGLVTLLQETGWRVFVDWADSTMPETPNRETAAKIKQRIVDTNYFLFLATSNSMSSRWCPWEIGYADGKKSLDRIIIIPTTDNSGTWHGNEYLQLYRNLDEAASGELGVWEPGKPQGGVYVRNL